MRYCIGYEDRQNAVGAIGFQQGQAGWTLVQIHAVPMLATAPEATTACGIGYSRVNPDINWFDPKATVGAPRCPDCVSRLAARAL